jgi:cell division protein FtsZ
MMSEQSQNDVPPQKNPVPAVYPKKATQFSNSCRIKVIGVGGGGCNAVNRMIDSTAVLDGVEMWSVNTDAQAIARGRTKNNLSIGKSTSRGLGAGGDPSVGAMAAEESREDISAIVKNTDLVFVTAGMGGGTGSGAAPVVAECAKEQGALTVGVVTKPFGFEGRKRMLQARGAIAEMKDKVDTLIVVSNDRLLQIVPEGTPLTDAFLVADDILRQGVVGISEIIVKPGLVNVDFADVRAIMGNAGTALMGIGKGKGKTRATDAALAAISSPLLDFPITRAKGIVFNVAGGPDLSLQEINAAAEVIYENVDPDANIIFGALVDDSMVNGEVSITVLATGFATDFYDGDEDEGYEALSPNADRASSDSSASASGEDGGVMQRRESSSPRKRRQSKRGGFRGMLRKIFG